MKILLICEAPMCKDAGGISQTLYNIFSFINPANILCIAPQNEMQSYPPSKPFQDRYISYNFEILNFKTNRLTRHFLELKNWINYSFLKYRKFSKVKKAITAFAPDIVISCPNGSIGAVVHELFLNQYKGVLMTYFMDDWMYQSNLKWWGGNIHNSVKNMLVKTDAWLMISDELANLLKDRYQIDNENIFVIRNPVDLSNAPEFRKSIEKNKYIIAYAGAIWDMHLDALILVATAVHQLKDKMDVELVIYCSDEIWNWRKKIFEPFGVKAGGKIPYLAIHNKLNQADLLLIVSSFSSKLFTHSKASLQTKITDYLKSKRLIVSCGPHYSANHNFLKKNDCGVCIESEGVRQITIEIEKILMNLEHYDEKIIKGFEILQKEFSFEVVHERFKNYLQSQIDTHKTN